MSKHQVGEPYDLVPSEPVEAAAFSADDLITESSMEAETFEIALSGGRRLLCRALRSTEEMLSQQRRALAFLKRCKDKSGCPPSWQEYLPISGETATMVVELVERVIAPKFTHIQALHMAKVAGPTLSVIHYKMLEQTGSRVPMAEQEALDDAKNA